MKNLKNVMFYAVIAALLLLLMVSFECSKDKPLVWIERDVSAQISLKSVPKMTKVQQFDAEKLKLPSVYFKFDEFSLSKEAEDNLDDVVRLLDRYKFISISIEGRTDCVGSEVYNERLGAKRALSAYHYLISNGIDLQSNRIIVYSTGEHRATQFVSYDPREYICDVEIHAADRIALIRVVED